MKSEKQAVPVTMNDMGVVIRETQWGDMNVAWENFPAGTNPAPLFKGLPDDLCQCPHWGYILKGRFTVHYKDHDEVVNEGEVYHLSPGHVCEFDADTEVVEFSPKGEYQLTLETVGRNIAAMQAAAH